jgi:hypothetical protein
MYYTATTIDKIKSEVEFKLNMLFNCIKFIGVRNTNIVDAELAMSLEFDNVDIYIDKLNSNSIEGYIYIELNFFRFSYSNNIWTWS